MNITTETNEKLISTLKKLGASFIDNALEFMRAGSDIVRELENRGVDVTAIDAPFITQLRRISKGLLLPEIAADVSFVEAAKYPISDQRKIADGHQFRVVDVEKLDPEDCRILKYDGMTAVERSMAFAKRDGYRTPSQQVVWARNEREKNALSKVSASANWSVDKKSREVVGPFPARLNRRQLMQMLSAIE